MTTVTVVAPDSSLAMDEVIRQLGENAYIVSTTHRDGQIEICATNEPEQEAKSAAKPEVKMPSFQDLLEAGGEQNPEPARSGGKKPRPSLRSVEGGLAQPEPMHQAPSVPDHAAGQNQNDLTLHEVTAKLTEAVGALNTILSQPAPQPSPLERLGFSPELIAQHSTPGLQGQAADHAILGSLARALINPEPLKALEAPIILVAGPSGGGKTVLAGKIAALLRETHPNRTVSLGTLCAEQPLAPRPLAAYARMLGLEHTIYSVESFDSLDEGRSKAARIIELSLGENSLEQILAGLGKKTKRGKICLIVALPTGSSPERISAELDKYKGLNAVIALCKLDECELSPREISAIARGNVQIAWLSGTRSLTGNLAPATFQMMDEFLEGLVFGQA